MIPLNEKEKEIESWADFLHVRWERYAREHKLTTKAQQHKQLAAFMAGGHAVLDAVLKMDEEKAPS